MVNSDVNAFNSEPTDNVITIDGPAAAGKTSVAKLVSQRLGYRYLDTGAMYRALALCLGELHVELSDDQQVQQALDNLSLEVKFDELANRIFIDEQDYTEAIRTPKASQLSSIASTLPSVRNKLVELQRRIGSQGRVVVEGRDMGTVVFPHARYKFFLIASLEARGQRRYAEEIARGNRLSLQEIIAEIQLRDQRDSNRKISPLKPAPDAVVIDTTQISVAGVVQTILDAVAKRAAPNAPSI